MWTLILTWRTFEFGYIYVNVHTAMYRFHLMSPTAAFHTSYPEYFALSDNRKVADNKEDQPKFEVPEAKIVSRAFFDRLDG